jgi:hypothetical protein
MLLKKYFIYGCDGVYVSIIFITFFVCIFQHNKGTKYILNHQIKSVKISNKNK